MRRLPPWLLVVAGVAVLALAVTFLVVKLSSQPLSAEVGDCLDVHVVNPNPAPADQAEQADCGAAEANVKVAVKYPDADRDCPARGYEFIYIGNPKNKLCLVINARQGDCFAGLSSGSEPYRRVPCTDAKAERQFVKIVEGEANEELCEEIDGATAVTFPQPPITFCLVKPKTI
ncbi:hypothetical protein HUW46_05533 [Amycolatopsis sp. CA-230715]|nr:hypothetical protein HUW46_05533 [Amycolatopsis sp. CA-230715]